jgi:tetratricopeptide (TPR) repeat protein
MPGEIPAWALTELADGDSGVAERLGAVGLLASGQVEAGGRHYRMHPLTRAYGREQEPTDRHISAVARLRDGWARRAGQAVAGLPVVPFVPTPALLPDVPLIDAREPWLDRNWLDSERGNLAAVIEQACRAGAHQQAAALAGRLTAHHVLAGSYAYSVGSWRAISQAAAAAGDHYAVAQATYCLAAVLAWSRDHIDHSVELLARCVPALEQMRDLDTAALGYCLLASGASADGRHSAAIRLARRAIGLAADRARSDLVHCCALTVLGLTLARIGMCDKGAQHCRQARGDARAAGQPVYESYAIRALAQVLILNGDYDQAANLCHDGIKLASAYGSAVDVARFGLVLGRARHCGLDHERAMDSLGVAADAFREAGLVLDEVTARSMLAACSTSAGHQQASAAQVEQVSEILARGGISGAPTRAAAARVACQLIAGQSASVSRLRTG